MFEEKRAYLLIYFHLLFIASFFKERLRDFGLDPEFLVGMTTVGA
jgi:hypothetical protein